MNYDYRGGKPEHRNARPFHAPLTALILESFRTLQEFEKVFNEWAKPRNKKPISVAKLHQRSNLNFIGICYESIVDIAEYFDVPVHTLYKDYWEYSQTGKLRFCIQDNLAKYPGEKEKQDLRYEAFQEKKKK